MAKKELQDYLLTRKAEREYRIKFAFQPKDIDMDRVERVLKKYDVVDIGPISKTIFQKNPVDFADIKNSEIWIFDIVLGFPVASYVLKEELRQLFKIAAKFIVVRGEDDPMDAQSDEIIEDDENAEHFDADEDAEARLNQSEYEEAEKIEAKDFYGDDYNEDMLKVFAEEKAKLDNRYHKYDFPAGEGLFPETAKDSDVKQDAGPTKESEASSPKWRQA